MRPLNIYLVAVSRAANVSGSTIYQDNILGTLTAGGHSVMVFNVEDEGRRVAIRDPERRREHITDGIVNRFLTAHRQKPFDLAFCLLDNTVVHPAGLEPMTRSVITVNYTTNYHQFHLVADVAPHVTLSTYISLPARHAFDRLGVRSFWMPMAANPDVYRPSATRHRFAAFIGTAYGVRPYYLWRLLQRGVDIRVYGPAWKPRNALVRAARNYGEPLLYALGNTEARLRFISRNERRLIIEHMNEHYPERMHDALSDADMIDTLATSEAVVNLAESRFDHDYLNPHVLRGCNFRDFEAPMAGTCLVTQHSPELEHFYEPGSEVLAFHDDIDLAEQLLAYQQNVEGLRRIAAAGHRRARSEHTWQRRFDALFEHLGLS